MNVKCEIIRDILPLYLDKLCSRETRMMVDEHLVHCKDCRKDLDPMQAELNVSTTHNEAELKKIRDPFKKIRTKFFLLSVLLLLFAAAISVAQPIYNELTTEKYTIDINSNVEQIDFAQLAVEVASVVGADGGKLYNFMGFSFFDIDRSGDILQFSTSFLVLRNNQPVHFNTRYKNNQLQIRRSWDVELSGEEITATYSEFPLSLLAKIPWEHLYENINTNDYDRISISNISTGDGAGNMRVDSGRVKSFLIEDNGEVARFEEETLLPFREYQAINFSPSIARSKNTWSGRIEVEYFFKVK